MEITFKRLHASILAGPFVGLLFVVVYQRFHDAQWLWAWLACYCAFAAITYRMRQTYQAQRREADANTLLARWRRRLELIALTHGAGVTAPMALAAGNANYELALLMVAQSGGIIAANAAMQTPMLSVFHRFFASGWCTSLLLHPWLLPKHWTYSIPIALIYTVIIYRQARIAHHFFVHQVWLEEQGQHLSAQYREARDAAEVALAEKNRFLSTAAHDLRQPVHAMGLLTEAIAVRNQDAALVAPLSDLRLSLQSVQLMFNSLLDLSKIESGQVAVRPEPLMLRPLFNELEIQFLAEARSRGLRLRPHMPPPGAAVLADAALLRQSLSNLVHNALRYTPKGGVLIGARRRQGHWRIEVWDTGLGVALEDRTRIYQPFYRPQHAWHINREGHGLGLAVVARCVDLMGAQHGLQSRLGAGSCFWLQLSAAAPAPCPASPRSQPTRQLQGRCLILDDDPHVLGAWSALLGSWGLQVCLASDARQAFAHVDTGQAIDVVLCDQRLRSGESGFDVLLALLARCPQARGAMVSGEFDAPALRRAEDEGYLVLKKPVDVADLQALLGRWLAAPVDAAAAMEEPQP
jgi:signal transduction histidine kinase/ActR/RegA family two-component response regulator